MQVEVVSEYSEFCALRKAWESLLNRSTSRSVFLGHEWLETWWKHFGKGNRLFVVLVRQGTELIGAAPLMISPWEGFRHLGMIAGGTVDYEDLLVDDKRDCVRVVGLILNTILEHRGWDFFQFNKLPDDSPNLHIMRTILEEHPIKWACAPFSLAPYVDVDCGWDEYWQSLRKKLRKDTERLVRRLSEDYGEIQYGRATDVSEVDSFMDTLIEQHVSRRRSQGDYSLFEDGHMVAFYKDLAKALSGSLYLDLQGLRVDGQMAAVHFGARYAGSYYYIMPTFDEAFGRYAVGRILLVHLLEEAFQEHLTEFDMLFGDEAYKFEFAAKCRQLLSLAIFQPTAKGLMAYWWFGRLRRQLRSSRKAQKLVPLLRRAHVLKRFS